MCKKKPKKTVVYGRNILKIDIPQSCSEILQQFNSLSLLVMTNC